MSRAARRAPIAARHVRRRRRHARRRLGCQPRAQFTLVEPVVFPYHHKRTSQTEVKFNARQQNCACSGPGKSWREIRARTRHNAALPSLMPLAERHSVSHEAGCRVAEITLPQLLSRIWRETPHPGQTPDFMNTSGVPPTYSAHHFQPAQILLFTTS